MDTTFARIGAGGVLIEVCSVEALMTHEPVLASTFIPCPDNMIAGSTFVNGIWTRVELPAIIPVPPIVTPDDALWLFESSERVILRAARRSDPALDDFMLVLESRKSVNLALPSVQNAFKYALTVARVDVPTRLAEILTGVLK